MMIDLSKYIGMCLMVLVSFNFISCSTAVRKQAIEVALQDSIVMKDSVQLQKMAETGFEFESDTLSASSLKAFELRAIQKLQDVAGYIQILSDPTIEKSFKLQAKQMMLDIFSEEGNTICINILSGGKPEKLTIKLLVDNLLANQFPKLKVEMLDIQAIQNLHRTQNNMYEGALTFWQTTYRIDKARTVKLNEYQMIADITLIRVVKEFGDTAKDVWEVFLGNIEAVETN